MEELCKILIDVKALKRVSSCSW